MPSEAEIKTSNPDTNRAKKEIINILSTFFGIIEAILTQIIKSL
jgi:hypothetical protein